MILFVNKNVNVYKKGFITQEKDNKYTQPHNYQLDVDP